MKPEHTFLSRKSLLMLLNYFLKNIYRLSLSIKKTKNIITISVNDLISKFVITIDVKNRELIVQDDYKKNSFHIKKDAKIDFLINFLNKLFYIIPKVVKIFILRLVIKHVVVNN